MQHDATIVGSGMVKTAPRQAPIMEVPLPTRQVGNKGVNKIGQEKPEIGMPPSQIEHTDQYQPLFLGCLAKHDKPCETLK